MTPELFAQLKTALGDAAKSLAPIGETLWREAMQRNLLYAWTDVVWSVIIFTGALFSVRKGSLLYREWGHEEEGVLMYLLSAVLTIIGLAILHAAAQRFCCPAISTATDLLRDMK